MDREEYILQLANDIEILAQLLNEKGINTSGFYNVSGLLKRNKNLVFKSQPIEIEFDSSCKFPKKLSHHKNAIDLKLLFDMDVDGDYQNILDKRDPFKKYVFNIVIKAKNKSNPSSILKYSLHLDRHNIEEQESGNSPIQAHPLYHFQFGGNEMKSDSIDFGQVLFLDSPRIMYHPMDFILAIDFIISNFFPTIWQDIKNNRQYKKILKKYQKDFIQPYYQSVIDHIENRVNDWDATLIYPQLIG